MPKEYILKRPPITSNRIAKITKSLVEESSEDRAMALEAYRYFKGLVANNDKDDASKNNMTTCLKLAQSSKINVTKLIDLLIKLESVRAKIDDNSSVTFHELDE